MEGGKPPRRTDTYRPRTRPLRPPCSASSKIARKACVPPGDGQSQRDAERGGFGARTCARWAAIRRVPGDGSRDPYAIWAFWRILVSEAPRRCLLESTRLTREASMATTGLVPAYRRDVVRGSPNSRRRKRGYLGFPLQGAQGRCDRVRRGRRKPLSSCKEVAIAIARSRHKLQVPL